MTAKKRRKDQRRSISVKGITHQRLKEYSDAQGKSVSGCLEEIIAAKLDAQGVPVPTELRPPPKALPETSVDEITSQFFTF